MPAAQTIKPESGNDRHGDVSTGNRLSVKVRVLDDGTRVVDPNDIIQELRDAKDHLDALRAFAKEHVGK